STNLDVLLRNKRQTVVACGGGTGKHTLPDTIDGRFLEHIAAEGEEEYSHAWPAVRRLLGRKYAFDAGFGVAPNHRGGVARHFHRGCCRPCSRRGRHDQPCRRHRKRFREGILDLDAVNGEW